MGKNIGPLYVAPKHPVAVPQNPLRSAWLFGPVRPLACSTMARWNFDGLRRIPQTPGHSVCEPSRRQVRAASGRSVSGCEPDNGARLCQKLESAPSTSRAYPDKLFQNNKHRHGLQDQRQASAYAMHACMHARTRLADHLSFLICLIPDCAGWVS